MLRGWLHLAWFEASLVVGTLLLLAAHGATQTTAVAIYASTVSGLFGVSALYHRGTWSVVHARLLQRADHTMIFFLIAGTATPGFLIATHGTYGLVCVSVLWALTLTVTTIHLAWMNAPERLVGATFIALGWMAGMAIPAIWVHAGVAPALLMLSGGLLYTAGACFYHRRWPDPVPAVFGYHEVFHTFVCAAATCQFIATALLI